MMDVQALTLLQDNAGCLADDFYIFLSIFNPSRTNFLLFMNETTI